MFYSIFWRRTQAKVGTVIIVGILALVLLGPYFVAYSPYAIAGAPNRPPSYQHPFGTDYLGHDLLSQVIYGAYPSLLVAVLSAFGAVLIGFFAGVFAGYYNKLDGIISGTTDLILTFPALPIMILVGILFIATDSLITVLLVIFLWAPVARSVRVQVATIKKMPFVRAARTSGMGSLRIIWKIIVPEAGSIAIAYFVLNTSIAIALVTALEFLGVGNPNVVSIGSILYWAQQFGFTAGDWWWIIAPGLLITLVATGLAFIGFAFEEIMDPRLRS